MSYCHDVIYLCSCVDPQMSEASKVQHLLRGLNKSLVEKVYPFLKTDQQNTQDFMKLVQIQCQANLLAHPVSNSPEISVKTLQSPVAHTPSPFVIKEELQQFKKDFASEMRRELNSTLRELKKEVSAEIKEIGKQLTDQLRDIIPTSAFKRTVSGEPICFRCNKSGHLGRNCPDLIRKCYICNSPSHLANRCDQRSPKEAKETNPTTSPN
jgi:hypothetical protein